MTLWNSPAVRVLAGIVAFVLFGCSAGGPEPRAGVETSDTSSAGVGDPFGVLDAVEIVHEGFTPLASELGVYPGDDGRYLHAVEVVVRVPVRGLVVVSRVMSPDGEQIGSHLRWVDRLDVGDHFLATVLDVVAPDDPQLLGADHNGREIGSVASTIGAFEPQSNPPSDPIAPVEATHSRDGDIVEVLVKGEVASLYEVAVVVTDQEGSVVGGVEVAIRTGDCSDCREATGLVPFVGRVAGSEGGIESVASAVDRRSISVMVSDSAGMDEPVIYGLNPESVEMLRSLSLSADIEPDQFAEAVAKWYSGYDGMGSG